MEVYVFQSAVSTSTGCMYPEVKLFASKDDAIKAMIAHHDEIYANMVCNFGAENVSDEDWDPEDAEYGFDIYALNDVETRYTALISKQSIL